MAPSFILLLEKRVLLRIVTVEVSASSGFIGLVRRAAAQSPAHPLLQIQTLTCATLPSTL